MKTPNEILKWLKSNLGPRITGGLTSTDTYALVTSVNLCNLISYKGAPSELFDAYRAIVNQMQPQNRFLAYHAIAIELDWCHRDMIWAASDLVRDNAVHGMCCYEPGGGGEERELQLRKQR